MQFSQLVAIAGEMNEGVGKLELIYYLINYYYIVQILYGPYIAILKLVSHLIDKSPPKC